MERLDSLEILRLTSIDDINPGVWNDLLRRNDINEIFLTHEWVTCWWNHARKDRELLLLVARENDQYHGIAPLHLATRKVGLVTFKAVEFLGTGEADYTDFIINPVRKTEILRLFLSFLESIKSEWDVISLRNIPERSTTYTRLQPLLADALLQYRDLPEVICPTLKIASDERFAAECARKKSLKRHFNYFNRNGCLSFSKIEVPKDVIELLPEFFHQHMERRAIVGDASKFHDTQIQKFYKCLAEKLADRQWLHFSVVRFDGVPIAFHFGFEYFGKFVWYKPVFNIDYAAKSPGEVLIKFLLEDAIARKLDEFDFTIGNEAFKTRFANAEHRNYGVEVFKGRLLFLYCSFAAWFKQYSKENLSWLYKRIKALLAPHRRSASIGAAGGTDKKKPRFPALLHSVASHIGKFVFRDTRSGLYVYRQSEGHARSAGGELDVREGGMSDLRALLTDVDPLRYTILVNEWFQRFRDGNRLYISDCKAGGEVFLWADPGGQSVQSMTGTQLEIDTDATLIYSDPESGGADSEPDLAAHFGMLAQRLSGSDSGNIYLLAGSAQLSLAEALEMQGFEPYVTVRIIEIFGLRCIKQVERTAVAS
jgi:CelD/BcsL family acetyltransferase involved in cellulose biosynthesis